MSGDGLWKRLEAAGAYRVTEIPRPDEGITPEEGSRSAADQGMSQRIAALAAAYHAGGLVAFGWVRTAVGGPVHVLAAGDALAGSAAGGAAARAGVGVLLALPGGARGTVLCPGELAGLLQPNQMLARDRGHQRRAARAGHRGNARRGGRQARRGVTGGGAAVELDRAVRLGRNRRAAAGRGATVAGRRGGQEAAAGGGGGGPVSRARGGRAAPDAAPCRSQARRLGRFLARRRPGWRVRRGMPRPRWPGWSAHPWGSTGCPTP